MSKSVGRLKSMIEGSGNSLAGIWPAATYRNSLGREVCRFTCKVRRERGKLLRPIRGQAEGRPGCGWQICKPEWDLSAPDVTTPPIPSESGTSRLYVPPTMRKWNVGDGYLAEKPHRGQLNRCFYFWFVHRAPILVEFSVRPLDLNFYFIIPIILHLFMGVKEYYLSVTIFRKILFFLVSTEDLIRSNEV